MLRALIAQKNNAQLYDHNGLRPNYDQIHVFMTMCMDR